MGDPVAFLRARQDEDERYCRVMKAAGERFRDNATPPQIDRDTPMLRDLFNAMLDDPEVVAVMTSASNVGAGPNDLDRLLREVEAKRRMLDRYEEFYARAKADSADVCASHASLVLLDLLLGFLPAYSGHPDYDPAWSAAS